MANGGVMDAILIDHPCEDGRCGGVLPGSATGGAWAWWHCAEHRPKDAPGTDDAYMVWLLNLGDVPKSIRDTRLAAVGVGR